MILQEYNLLRRVWRWLRQVRHRCGYGVHSPLAFQFITDVVYNSDAYYAYETLRQPLEPSLARCDEYDPDSGIIAKDLRLLFRLVNYQCPSFIVHSGASPIVLSYLSAARNSAEVLPLSAAGRPLAATSIFAYVDACQPSAVDAVLQQFADCSDTLVVVRGIHRDAPAQQCWHKLQEHPAVTLTFDLGRFGVALRRDKINKQHYVVNYF